MQCPRCHDPEDMREVVQAYQEVCAQVIRRLDRHAAQYLGDGLLVYFGYPVAHEDDAQRATGAALGIVGAMEPLNARVAAERAIQLAVRLGIDTGLVVVGELGGEGAPRATRPRGDPERGRSAPGAGRAEHRGDQ